MQLDGTQSWHFRGHLIRLRNHVVLLCLLLTSVGCPVYSCPPTNSIFLEKLSQPLSSNLLTFAVALKSFETCHCLRPNTWFSLSQHASRNRSLLFLVLLVSDSVSIGSDNVNKALRGNEGVFVRNLGTFLSTVTKFIFKSSSFLQSNNQWWGIYWSQWVNHQSCN